MTPEKLEDLRIASEADKAKHPWTFPLDSAVANRIAKEVDEARQAKTAAVTPRRALLEAAADTIDGDRDGTYGGPEGSFTMIAKFWSTYLGIEIAPYDVGAMMGLFKTARIKASKGKHKDSWLDLAGYAGCGWETVEVPVPTDMEPAESYKNAYASMDRIDTRDWKTPAEINAEALKKIQEELQGMQPIGPGTVGWQGVK